ncbi:MAG TPA: hypothetical protein VGM51_09535 [Armatimonadota bacterium]|jgi:hypothetical protein
MSTIVTNVAALNGFKTKLRSKQSTVGIHVCASFPYGGGATYPDEQGWGTLFNRRMATIGGYGGAMIGGNMASTDGYCGHYPSFSSTAGTAFGMVGGGMGNAAFGGASTTRSGDTTIVTFRGRYLDIIFGNPGYPALNCATVTYSVNCVPPVTGSFSTAPSPDGTDQWNRCRTIDCGYDAEHTVTLYKSDTTYLNTRIEGIVARMASGRGYIGANLSINGTNLTNVATFATTLDKAMAIWGCQLRHDGTRYWTPDIGFFDLFGNEWLTGPADAAALAALYTSSYAKIDTVFGYWATRPFPIVIPCYPRRKSDTGTAGVNDGATSDQYMRDCLTRAQAAHPMVVGVDMTDLWGGTRAGAVTAGWLTGTWHPTTAGHASIENEISRALGLAGAEYDMVIRDTVNATSATRRAILLSGGAGLIWHKGDTGPGAFIETTDSAQANVDLSALYTSATVVIRRTDKTDVVLPGTFTSAVPPGGTETRYGIACACPPTDTVSVLNVAIHLTTESGTIETIPNELTWFVRA